MKCSKISRSFDSYKAELSYAELMAIQTACAKAGDPIADDVSKAIEWYVANELPGPGEDESPDEEAKEAGEAEEAGEDLGEPLQEPIGEEPPELGQDVQAAADEILDEPSQDEELPRRGVE